MKPFDPSAFAPESIDALILKAAKRRQVREWLSMIFAGVVVTVMVVTFYRILVS